MPANPKYLNTNKWQRFAKISAGILGGLLVSETLHLAITQWWFGDFRMVIYTWLYSIFLVWMTFLFIPFFFNNGWKCWGIYLLLITCFVGAFLLGKTYHPI